MGIPGHACAGSSHLDRDGMVSMSNAVAEVLSNREWELTPARRWVALPAYRGPATVRFPLGDLDQSLLAVGSRSDIDQRRPR